MEAAHFFRVSKVLTLITFFCTFNLKATDLYSRQSGNWTDINTWQLSTGAPAGTSPGRFDNVFLRAGYTVTLDANATCSNLQIDAPSVDGSTILSCGNKNLSVNGDLVLYEGNSPRDSKIARINVANGNITVTGSLIFNSSSLSRAVFDVSGNSTITLMGVNSYNSLGTFNKGTSTVVYNSSADQYIFPFDYYNLQISNTGNKTVLGDISTDITGTLQLNGGVMKLDGHTLTVDNKSPGAIVRTTGGILSEDVTLTAGHANNNSKIAWNIKNDGSPHVYPFINTSGFYIPVTIDPPNFGNMGYVTIATFKTNPDNDPLPVDVAHVSDRWGVDNSANTADRFWQISASDPTAEATITFTYDQVEVPANGELGPDGQGMRAQSFDNSANYWNAAEPGQSFDATNNTVSVPSTHFGGGGLPASWTLALKAQPLPVEILQVKALNLGDLNVIKWETASENNVNHYEVYRSTNGLIFYAIGKTQSMGGPAGYNYSFNDMKIPENITMVYYKVKQVDEDGSYKYTNSVVVNVDPNSGNAGKVYPVPAKEVLNISLKLNEDDKAEGEARMEIVDLMGRVNRTEIKNLHSGLNEFQTNVGNLEKGIYLVKIYNESGFINYKKFLKS